MVHGGRLNMGLELNQAEASRLVSLLEDSDKRAERHPFSYSEESELKIIELVDRGISNARINKDRGVSLNKINQLKKKYGRWGR